MDGWAGGRKNGLQLGRKHAWRNEGVHTGDRGREAEECAGADGGPRVGPAPFLRVLRPAPPASSERLRCACALGPAGFVWVGGSGCPLGRRRVRRARAGLSDARAAVRGADPPARVAAVAVVGVSRLCPQKGTWSGVPAAAPRGPLRRLWEELPSVDAPHGNRREKCKFQFLTLNLKILRKTRCVSSICSRRETDQQLILLIAAQQSVARTYRSYSITPHWQVKVVTGKDGQTGTPVAIATQLPPNVSAAFSSQQQPFQGEADMWAPGDAAGRLGGAGVPLGFGLGTASPATWSLSSCCLLEYAEEARSLSIPLSRVLCLAVDPHQSPLLEEASGRNCTPSIELSEEATCEQSKALMGWDTCLVTCGLWPWAVTCPSVLCQGEFGLSSLPYAANSKANMEYFGIYNRQLVALSCEILFFAIETGEIVRRYFFENQSDHIHMRTPVPGSMNTMEMETFKRQQTLTLAGKIKSFKLAALRTFTTGTTAAARSQDRNKASSSTTPPQDLQCRRPLAHSSSAAPRQAAPGWPPRCHVSAAATAAPARAAGTAPGSRKDPATSFAACAPAARPALAAPAFCSQHPVSWPTGRQHPRYSVELSLQPGTRQCSPDPTCNQARVTLVVLSKDLCICAFPTVALTPLSLDTGQAAQRLPASVLPAWSPPPSVPLSICPVQTDGTLPASNKSTSPVASRDVGPSCDLSPQSSEHSPQCRGPATGQLRGQKCRADRAGSKPKYHFSQDVALNIASVNV
ncbi:hypothetical protein HPG69_014133 [Diceros bicornis minor]|uniref:E1A-binding protein p400 N-terminal domain-containing protein n=1 Tax=Diceros bicornis minor TaxID=77932 RepID=A0A7J7EM14_DICBM|nr:hypothetical protein HPG69_014133 [Diceros bicornis minor]